MTGAKQHALDQIATLADQHGISIDEIAVRLNKTKPSVMRDGGGSLLKTLMGYVGGIFVFSGVCLLIGMMWDDMSSAERVIITFGPGLIAFIMGALCLKDQRFEKAATPFFLAGAGLQPTGMFVYMHEYLQPTGDMFLPVLGVSGVMLAQQFAGFLKWRRSSLAFFSIMFWAFFIGTALGKLRIDGDLAAVTLSLSLMCLSAAADRSPHRAIAPFWYFIGTAGLLSGYFELIRGSSLELSYLGLNAFMVWLSISLASRTVLLVSVAGLMGWLAWYTDKYFAHVIGWPVALIILGFVMIALSAYAMKLGRMIKASSA
ncbi:MAG TPA: DUF2157 domain-containing protein [Patescibacteria group bacterium]|jgi:hypothetical protein|nr:DUF2157 domain-containing protein [Patescibacteria group bacterium]